MEKMSGIQDMKFYFYDLHQNKYNWAYFFFWLLPSSWVSSSFNLLYETLLGKGNCLSRMFPSGDTNLGPKAFPLLEFEIAP